MLRLGHGRKGRAVGDDYSQQGEGAVLRSERPVVSMGGISRLFC